MSCCRLKPRRQRDFVEVDHYPPASARRGLKVHFGPALRYLRSRSGRGAPRMTKQFGCAAISSTRDNHRMFGTRAVGPGKGSLHRSLRSPGSAPGSATTIRFDALWPDYGAQDRVRVLLEPRGHSSGALLSPYASCVMIISFFFEFRANAPHRRSLRSASALGVFRI